MNETKPRLHRFVQGHRGYLLKQGKVFRQWRPRYFVLEKRRLKIFADDTLAASLGEVVIDDSVQLFDILEEVEGRKNLFYVIGKNPKGEEELVFVAAANEKDKGEWIEAICDAVHDGFKQIYQPDVWSNGSFYPSVDMLVQYKDGIVADNGVSLRPALIEHTPEVILRGVGQEERFSLIMLDADPVMSDPQQVRTKSDNFYLHWGVINFTGSNLSTGDELAKYVSPAPPYNSGMHRYFFLLFKHPSRMVISQIVFTELVEMFMSRESFPFRRWTGVMNLGTPVAINGFYAGWDEHCDLLHRKMNYLPPEAHRSPTQCLSMGREEERIKIEKAKRDLYRDLDLEDIFGGVELEELLSLSAALCPDFESKTLSVEYHPISGDSGTTTHKKDSAESKRHRERARDGGILSVQHTQQAPVVTWAAEDDDDEVLYTLVLTDPDSPSRVSAKEREVVHWVVANIPGGRLNSIKRGTEVLPYLGPAPAYSSGLHRYVFCLYRQTDALTEEELTNARTFFAPRRGLKSYNDWVCAASPRGGGGKLLQCPIAIEAFLSKWDTTVDALHKAMGWLPPAPYLSPQQMQSQAAKERDGAFAPGTSLPLGLSFAEAAVAAAQLQAQQQSSTSTTSTGRPSSVALTRGGSATLTGPQGGGAGGAGIAGQGGAQGGASSNRPLRQLAFELQKEDHAARLEALKQQFIREVEDAVNRTSASTVTPPAGSPDNKDAPGGGSRKQEHLMFAAPGMRHVPIVMPPAATELAPDARLDELLSKECSDDAHRLDKLIEQLLTQKTEDIVCEYEPEPEVEEVVEDALLTDNIERESSAGSRPSSVKSASAMSVGSASQHDTGRPPVPRSSSIGSTHPPTGKKHPNGAPPLPETHRSSMRANDSQTHEKPPPPVPSARPQSGGSQRGSKRLSGLFSPSRDERDEEDTVSIGSDRSGHTTKSSGGVGSSLRKMLSRTFSMSGGSSSSTPARKAAPIGTDDLDNLLKTGYSSHGIGETSGKYSNRAGKERDNSSNASSDDDYEAPRSRSDTGAGGLPVPANILINGSASFDLSDQPNRANNGYGSGSGGNTPRSLLKSQTQYGAASTDSGDPRNSKNARMYSKNLSGSGDAVKPATEVQKIQSTLDYVRQFGVKSVTVFDGELMKKKHSADFMGKESYLWIDVPTRSLHWAKSKADKANIDSSKYIVLDRINAPDSYPRPAGEPKGVFKSVVAVDNTLHVTLESGVVLELKLSDQSNSPVQQRVADWVKMLQIFS